MEAADANGDGIVNLADGIFVLKGPGGLYDSTLLPKNRRIKPLSFL